MAAARGGIKSNPDLLSVAFNQDHSCIATGTRKGYTITNCDPFGKVYGRSDGATSIVEMLFCTSLVALVGAGDRPSSSTRRLQIVNTKRQSTICELTFPTTILAVKLNRRRLVVVLEERIYVYDISNMKLLHEIETSPNPNAICALSPSSENSYLAYPSPLPSPTTPFSTAPPSSSHSSSSPSSQTSGDVLLFDAVSLSVTNIIQAHKSPVAHVSLNQQGTLLATASDKGTVIRVFSLPNGDKVHEFRRGSYPARIYSISFNAVSSLLCVSSDTETVHIFKLTGGGKADKAKKPSLQGGAAGAARSAVDWESGEDRFGSANGGSDAGSTVGGYEALIDSKRAANAGGVSGSIRRKSLSLGRNLAGSVGGFLPGAVTGMWDPQRDFAYLKVPTSGVKSVVAISGSSPQVMVVTSEGVFYSYAIDLEHGGECVLQKSYSLLDGMGEDANGSPMGD
ncbi:hypothetical protein JCM5296_000801 [Sporobolomyces johnsonii]